MPRTAVQDHDRISLRIKPKDKAKIMRASALESTDLTNFILRNAVEAADAVIERSERIALSKRDSLKVLDLLERPPAANAKLRAAARALSAKK
jgi:uncharacterized protein (DUF1778 family)